jgi:hypothetical protein
LLRNLKASMTLHEAIEFVLIETKRELTARELAQMINEKQLYIRRDLQPVTSNQVLARVGNYKNWFSLKGANVVLKNVEERDLVLEEIKQLFLLFVNQIRKTPTFIEEEKLLSFILVAIAEIDTNNGSTGKVGPFFDKITAKSRFRGGGNFFESNLFHPTMDFLFRVQKYPHRNEIIQRLIYWIQEIRNSSRWNVLPNYLCSIIGRIDLFGEKTVILSTTQNMLNNYKLNIFDNNPNTNFIHGFRYFWENDEVIWLNGIMLNASAPPISSTDETLESQMVGIFTPPWGMHTNKFEGSGYYMEIMNELEESKNSRLDKALLIVPETALFTGGKDLVARITLTNSKCLESVITLPYSSKISGVKSVAILLFDFKKKTDQVFFADFNQLKDFEVELEWNNVSSLFNTKEQIKDLSKLVSYEKLIEQDFSWLPSKYLVESTAIQLKQDHALISITKLIRSSRRGANIDRERLYEGGEIKFIRTTDLSDDSIFFKVNPTMLGIDSDELEKKPLLTKNNLLVTLMGNSLKPTILPDNEVLLFSSSIALLEVDTQLILPEFLAIELKQEYVAKQMIALRRGVTVPFVSISDFRKLQIQVPSLGIQKDILLSIRRNRNELVHNHSLLDGSNKAILHNYLGIIKHTMKQPLATLSEDIKSISTYLMRKSKEQKVDLNDFIIDLLPGEKEKENEESRVQNTLDRLVRAINDAHWRFEQSEKLLKIETSEIQLKPYEVLEMLKEQVKNYSGIQFSVKGKKKSALIDQNLWSILMDNLIDNARKHGFINQTDCRILFETSTQQRADGSEEIVIAYYNNGTPLPDHFDGDLFVTNGISTNKQAGDGFGGYLINNILKKHEARIEVVPSKELLLNEYNVCFKIYLNAI